MGQGWRSVVGPWLALWRAVTFAIASRRFVRWGMSWNGTQTCYLLAESLPLAIGSAFVLVYGRIDIILLESIKGVDQAGLYGVAYKFFDVLSTVSATVMIVLFPGLARAYAKGTIFTIANPEAAVRIVYEVFPQTKPTGKDEATAVRERGGTAALLDNALDERFAGNQCQRFSGKPGGAVPRGNDRDYGSGFFHRVDGSGYVRRRRIICGSARF